MNYLDSNGNNLIYFKLFKLVMVMHVIIE
jgi:hypothetical protein